METKLLKFNRFMSNFSTKLVGGFVPVIVYKYAPMYKMQLALLTCAIQYLCSFIFNLLFRNILTKKPQLFLFLRIFPIILYEILLLFVEKNPILCAIGIGLGYSFSYVFKNLPSEVLVARNNATKKSGTGVQLALFKLIDQFAVIISTIIGGVALDNFDIKYLIIISLSLYLIGSFPMLIYYFVHKKDGNINQEYSTYEHIALKEQSYDTTYAKSVSTKVTKTYLLFYFLQESYNAMYIFLPLKMFTIVGNFTVSSIASSLFDGVFGIACYLFGKLEHKKDITALSVIGGITVGVMGTLLMFVTAETIWTSYIIISFMAMGYAVAYIFMYNRMLMKCKIIGRSAEGIFNKINMYFVSTFFISCFGLFLPLQVCFYVASGMSVLSGALIPSIEERTRRILVDHFEDNEIKDDYRIIKIGKRKDIDEADETQVADTITKDDE